MDNQHAQSDSGPVPWPLCATGKNRHVRGSVQTQPTVAGREERERFEMPGYAVCLSQFNSFQQAGTEDGEHFCAHSQSRQKATEEDHRVTWEGS